MTNAESQSFHTQKGYDHIAAASRSMTAAMEDYLEMICRLSRETGYTRVRLLAQTLNVRPSSASKMVDNLRLEGLVRAEKYGCIEPTNEGIRRGQYLLYRHSLLNRFICYINGTPDELELVERIEHFIDARTVKNIAAFMERAESESGWERAVKPIEAAAPEAAAAPASPR